MGQSFQFYAGDPHEIGEAARNLDFDKLNNRCTYEMKADLSLHLEPRDLDALSSEAADLLVRPAILLRDSFEQIICDEPDHGAMLINKRWVDQFAAIPVNASNELAEKWINAMRILHNDPDISVTPDIKKGVAALVQLCSFASASSLPVVHVWYL